MMKVVPREYDQREKPVTYQDTVNDKGDWFVERRQSFAMPTIERERLANSKLDNRLPRPDLAFPAPF
jgi:hypothetical protein